MKNLRCVGMKIKIKKQDLFCHSLRLIYIKNIDHVSKNRKYFIKLLLNISDYKKILTFTIT